MKRGQNWKKNYSGPVMVEGNVVGEVFLSSLFTSNFSLRAWRNDLVFEDYNKVYFERKFRISYNLKLAKK